MLLEASWDPGPWVSVGISGRETEEQRKAYSFFFKSLLEDMFIDFREGEGEGEVYSRRLEFPLKTEFSSLTIPSPAPGT